MTLWQTTVETCIRVAIVRTGPQSLTKFTAQTDATRNRLRGRTSKVIV